MRHNVSVYIPLPIRCGNCQKYGHRTDQCKRDKPRCPRCTEAHDYSACTVPDEQIKCSNCGENHSSAYRGCKKYREISAALRKAATENITYRDAVKKLKDSTANNNQDETCIAPETAHTSTATTAATVTGGCKEKKSVETQTENNEATQTSDINDPIMSSEQIVTLIKSTATVLLWLVKETKTSPQQSQVMTQLKTMLDIIGAKKSRRNSEPPVLRMTVKSTNNQDSTVRN